MAYRNFVKQNIYQYNVRNHKQKVQSLYKRMIRNIENWTLPDVPEFRYQAVLIRQKFDENRNIKDLRLAKLLMKQANDYLNENIFPQPLRYNNTPGGITYNRYHTFDDIILDYWHPYEKAQYPEYFAKREAAKEEYLKLFEQDYGDAKKILGVEETVNYLEVFQDMDLSADPKKEEDED